MVLACLFGSRIQKHSGCFNSAAFARRKASEDTWSVVSSERTAQCTFFFVPYQESDSLEVQPRRLRVGRWSDIHVALVSGFSELKFALQIL